MSWLDALLDPKIAAIKAAPKRFLPSVIHDFHDLLAMVGLGEQALVDLKNRMDEERRAHVIEIASNPESTGPFFVNEVPELYSVLMTMPMIHRRAMFIAVCSHVEHLLRHWCAWIQDEWSLQPTFARFPKLPHPARETDIHHCMRYLRDVAGLNALADFERWPEWLLLDAARVARNKLAHNAGIIEDRERAAVTALPHVTIEENSILGPEPMVWILPEACEAAIVNADNFFKRLAAVGEADPRAKAVLSP